jgi:SAM-dependent methyltransferase
LPGLSDTEVWEEYAPFFNLEEGTVFQHDLPEMEFYARLRNLHPGPCLEIGAGGGRLASSLSPGGFTTALEPSRAMIESWSSGDARLAARVRALGQTMPFLAGVFRLACFPYNGLQCILDHGERRAVFSEAFRVLEPGGVLVFEISPAFHRRPAEGRSRRYRAEVPGGALILDEEVLRPEGAETVVYDMFYTTLPHGGEPDIRRVVLELAAFPVMEAVDDCSGEGFRVEALWGDYHQVPFDPEESPRLIVMAVKE